MDIKMIKRTGGEGVLIFHEQEDEGSGRQRSFRLLLNPEELQHFAAAVQRLALTPADRAFDLVVLNEEINIGLYGFREVA